MDEGCILIVLPATIMGNAPHPNAAKLFMEWLGSEEYAALVVEEYNVSMLKGFPPRQGVRPLSEIKTIQPATERIIKGIPELTELWRDKFGV